MLAANYGRVGVLCELIRRGADLEARDKNGHTALYLAQEASGPGATRILLASGASPNGYATDSGMPALMLAAYCGLTETVRLLLDHRAAPTLRAREGTDPMTSQFVGLTSLEYAWPEPKPTKGKYCVGLQNFYWVAGLEN